MDPGFPTPAHDHARCVAEALGAAECLCRRRGVRFTDIRRRVLALIWRSHRPISAYELLDALAEQGRKAQPPTVYRALEFLSAQGLIHRLESLNAYFGCAHPGHPHEASVFVCRACGRVAERACPAAAAGLRRGAAEIGFSIERQCVEVIGMCHDCRPA